MFCTSLAAHDPARTSTASLLGVDVGGSRTRVLLARSNGTVIGRGHGPGANRFSSVTRLEHALTEALTVAFDRAGADAAPADVCAAVVAVAGLLHGDGARGEVERALAAVGIRTRLRVVPDFVANHAAGSQAPDGLVLVAGTGAVAARILGRQPVARADGSGWLLGDEGSAVWFALEAIRAVLRGWDGRGTPTSLAGPVIRELLGPAAPTDREPASEVVAAVSRRSAASLGALAPPVLALADEDEVAATILRRAADALAGSALAAAGDSEPAQLVVAGSVLLGASNLRRAILERLRGRWPSVVVSEGRDGAAGAAVIALEDWDAGRLTPRIHRRLVGPVLRSD